MVDRLEELEKIRQKIDKISEKDAEAIISEAKKKAEEIVSEERKLIEQEEKSLAEKAKSIETQDVIYRSLALLKSAKLMSNDEAMKLISNVRAGMFTGVIKNTDYAMLNRLNEQIQPATLMTAEGKELSPQQRDIKRAEILNREFGRI